MPFGLAADARTARRQNRGLMLRRILRINRANQPPRGRSVRRVLPTLRILIRRIALPALPRLSASPVARQSSGRSFRREAPTAALARAHPAAPQQRQGMKMLGGRSPRPHRGSSPGAACAARRNRAAMALERPGPAGRSVGRRRGVQLQRARPEGARPSQPLVCPTRRVSTAIAFYTAWAQQYAAVNPETPALRAPSGQPLTTKPTGTSSWI